MPVLLNHTTPFLRILNPVTGEYTQFSAGKLEIEPGDDNYEVVMAEASRNPSIVIIANATTCPYCGEMFEGKGAKDALGGHIEDAHFDRWDAEQQAQQAAARAVIVKERAGYACDVCAPVATFPTKDELAFHTRLVHVQNGEQEEPAKDARARRRSG